MFILKKILFSRPFFSLFLLPAVSCPQTEIAHSTYASDTGVDNKSCTKVAKRAYFVSFTFLKSNPLSCVYVLQSVRYATSSVSTVFDAVTAVAGECTVISSARSLNRLNGSWSWLQIPEGNELSTGWLLFSFTHFSVSVIFLCLNWIRFFSFSQSFSYFHFSFTVIVIVNWLDFFSYFAFSVTVTVNLNNTDIFSTCPHNMANVGPLMAEIGLPVVWGTPTHFNGFRVLAALLHGTLVVGVSQTSQSWTEGATYIRQGGHHVGHWPTF